MVPIIASSEYGGRIRAIDHHPNYNYQTLQGSILENSISAQNYIFKIDNQLGF
jgi:hypothetical protein